jgi:hypothetical protein
VVDTTCPSIGTPSESDDPICRQGTGSPDTVTISARITDDQSGVSWARLCYRLGAGTGWEYVPMSRSGDTYSATIGPFSSSGTLHYYIWAGDNAGNECDSSVYAVTVEDCVGCPPDLGVFDPEIHGCTVIINGVVTSPCNDPVQRIHWDWGDGTSNDSWFPAIHTYAQAGTYMLTVTAYTAAGYTATDTETVTVSECVLSKPIHISPNNGGATCGDLRVNIDWSDVPNATGFKLQISTDPSFSYLVVDDSGPGSSYTWVTLLKSPGTYYWRVKAVDDGRDSGWTSPWSFVVEKSPSRPTLSWPTNWATDVSLSPTLTWSPSSGASSYTLEYADNRAFLNPTKISGIRDTAYTLEDLVPETTYWWKVSAKNTCGSSGVSSIWSFTTGSTTADLNIIDVFFYGTPIAFEPIGIVIRVKNVGNARFEATDGNYTVSITVDDHPVLPELFPYWIQLSSRHDGGLVTLEPARLPSLEPDEWADIAISNFMFPTPGENVDVIFKIAYSDPEANRENNSEKITINVLESPHRWVYCVGTLVRVVTGPAGAMLWDLVFDTGMCRNNVGCLATKIAEQLIGIIPIFKLPIFKLYQFIQLLIRAFEESGRCTTWLMEFIPALLTEFNKRGITTNAVIVESPAYAMVTDIYGRQVGFSDDGTIVTEIPDAIAWEQAGKKFILYPGSDSAVVRLKGTGTGTLDLTLVHAKGEGSTTWVSYLNVPSTPATIGTINMLDEDYVMDLDENSDGIVDSTRPPDSVTIIRSYTAYLPIIFKNYTAP